MTVKTKITMTMGIALIAIATAFTSCKEENDAHTPPSLTFKTGGIYTSANDSVSMGDIVVVGIIADKTEDELKTLNVSHQFDAATTSTTQDNFTLTAAQEEHYELDYPITARNAAGSEKWIFTITDRDGNIASQSITLTVN